MLNETNTTVGDVLTIDNKPVTATVDYMDKWGVYIVTSDKCRIPFSWKELNDRHAKHSK